MTWSCFILLLEIGKTENIEFFATFQPKAVQISNFISFPAPQVSQMMHLMTTIKQAVTLENWYPWHT